VKEDELHNLDSEMASSKKSASMKTPQEERYFNLKNQVDELSSNLDREEKEGTKAIDE